MFVIFTEFESRFQFHRDIPPPTIWKPGPKTYPSHAATSRPKSKSSLEKFREKLSKRDRHERDGEEEVVDRNSSSRFGSFKKKMKTLSEFKLELLFTIALN